MARLGEVGAWVRGTWGLGEGEFLIDDLGLMIGGGMGR
jgi:hypothetical protein